MEVAAIEVDREEARKRVEEFTAKRRRKLTEMDQALYRGYKALAEGLTLIDVNKAIQQGGHFEDNYGPKLAIVRSDIERVYLDHQFRYEGNDPAHHNVRFLAWNWYEDVERRPEAVRHLWAKDQTASPLDLATQSGLMIDIEDAIASPIEARKGRQRWYKAKYETMVPAIPFHLRPNGDASRYFIMWEVDKWSEVRPRSPPGDPLLLERIAHPIYVVVAQWDLTELEKRILESFRR